MLYIAIYGNMYHQYTPNVSIYTIHGSYGYWEFVQSSGYCFWTVEYFDKTNWMSDVNGKPGKTTGLFLLHLHVCFITEFLLPIVLDSMHLKQLTFFPSRSSRKSNRTHKQIWIVIFIIHTSSCSFWARLFLGVSWSRGTPKPLVSPLNMTNWIIFSAPPLFENMLPRARELIVFFVVYQWLLSCSTLP